MINVKKGNVIMSGTQSEILAEFSMIGKSIRKATLDGTLDVVKGEEDEFLKFVAEIITKELTKEEEKKLDEIPEGIKEKIENFIDEIIGGILGEDK